MNKVIDLLKNHLPNYLKTHKVDQYKLYVLQNIIKCYDHMLGYVVNACRDCGRTYLVAMVCKLRYCFNCGPTQHYRWLAKLSEFLPHCPYNMITFTLPLFVRPFFKTSFKYMVNLQFKAVSFALKKFSAIKNFEPGFIMVLQLVGGYMLPHPHIHVVITLGGLFLNGFAWKSYREYYAITISQYYTEYFIELLKAAYAKGKIALPPEYLHLTTIEKFNTFIDSEVDRIIQLRKTNYAKRSKRSDFIKNDVPLTETKAKSWCVCVSRKPAHYDYRQPPVGYISRYVATPPITNHLCSLLFRLNLFR
jgi:hypothetical protein